MCGGAVVDWAAWEAHGPRRRLVLPTYPFQRRRHWYDLSGKTEYQTRAVVCRPTDHPLLGRRVPSAGGQRLFQARLSASNPSYLAEHRIQGSAVVPAAAFIEQSLAAANEVFGQGDHVVENLSIQSALVLGQDVDRITQVVMSRESHGECRFESYSQASKTKSESESNNDKWDLHACGTLRVGANRHEDQCPESIDVPQVLQRVTAETEREAFYQAMADCGLAYGVKFQVLGRLKQTPSEALARVEPPSQLNDQAGQYRLHPAILDGCFQLVAGVVPLDQEHTGRAPLYLPTFVRRVRFHGQPAKSVWAYARRTSTDVGPAPEIVEANVSLLDEAGRVLVELVGVRATRVGKTTLEPGQPNPANWLYRIDWRTQILPQTIAAGQPSIDPPASWLVFADQQGIADRLVETLRRRGDWCTVVRPGSEFQTISDNGSQTAGSYQIDPLSSCDYERLLQQWSQSKNGPRGVIHLWNVDLTCDEQMGPGSLAQGTRLGCASAL